VRYPKGHEKNSMSDGEIEQKFTELCSAKLNAEQREKVISLLWQLERVPDIRAVTAALAITEEMK
jgi:2-methylcitrate dehydratase